MSDFRIDLRPDAVMASPEKADLVAAIREAEAAALARKAKDRSGATDQGGDCPSVPRTPTQEDPTNDRT